MKPAFFAPRGMKDNKPPHGQPCNNCGLCCMGTLCPLAAWVFRGDPKGGTHPGPCPALMRDGTAFVCGLVVDPARFALAHVIRAGGKEKASAAAKILNGCGLGCDARVNGEPGDEAFYERLRKFDHENQRATKAARRTWGAR